MVYAFRRANLILNWSRMRLFIIWSAVIVLSQTSITLSTYTVAILNNGKLICNGALIDEEFIVTSASCGVVTKSSELTIRAGSENYNGGGVQAKVSKIVTHKKYNNSTHDYDIAILKLKGCLAISTSHVDIIPIAQKRISIEEGGTLTGWVVEDIAGPLQLKSVDVQRHSGCEHHTAVNMTKRMFCTGITNIENCIDFLPGSPLVVEGQLIGVKSFGFPCDQNRPDVFTNVSVLLKFVQKVLKRLA